MSLGFKLPAPHERFYATDAEGNRRLDPKVQACVMLTMCTTIGKLATPEDAVEHYVRARFVNRGEEAFPLETALSLVGLATNVFPRESESKFLARVGKGLLSDMRYLARGAAEKLQKAS